MSLLIFIGLSLAAAACLLLCRQQPGDRPSGRKRRSAPELESRLKRDGASRPVPHRMACAVPLQPPQGGQWDGSPYTPLQPPVFSIRSLGKSYRDAAGSTVRVLDGVEGDIGEGVTAILGPSGQGKSTLLNLLGGLDVPTTGSICYRGQPIPTAEGPALRVFRAERIAWIFQDLNLIGHLTAEENVALPLLCRGVGRSQALKVARKNLELVGLSRLSRQRPALLSGGERQRVAIARAFSSGADVILADEPTGSLDPDNAGPVMQMFQQLAHASGRPVVLVTHNHDLARRYCDRLLRLTPDGLVSVPGGEDRVCIRGPFVPRRKR